jgi:alcohol dehydrogenase class IV
LKLPTVTYAIPSEPTLDMVIEGRALAISESCDAVVAFGGGSAIDAGKAIAALGLATTAIFSTTWKSSAKRSPCRGPACPASPFPRPRARAPR